ncbi:MAG TPA: class I SAM-dependent methyltransferase [Chthonomonadaceae bacterium]|nr:class I SAM-dependent methyltransferase [Chthonomonadaceae bacterium]
MSEPQLLDPQAAYALWAADYPPYAHNALMRAEERAMLSLLPADLRGKNVLDAGCGSGRYILHARRRGARHVLGVDLSPQMLARARTENADTQGVRLLRAGLEALPLPDGWAAVTLCGLTLGHLESLQAPLAELCRVTRPGGLILCSDFHPIGAALGWQRTFKVNGQKYAVRHTPYYYADWHRACRALNLRILEVLEPRLDPADIPPGAHFDPKALEVPVALALALQRQEKAR